MLKHVGDAVLLGQVERHKADEAVVVDLWRESRQCPLSELAASAYQRSHRFIQFGVLASHVMLQLAEEVACVRLEKPVCKGGAA